MLLRMHKRVTAYQLQRDLAASAASLPMLKLFLRTRSYHRVFEAELQEGKV